MPTGSQRLSRTGNIQRVLGIALLLNLMSGSAAARQEVAVSAAAVVDGDTFTCLYRGQRLTVDLKYVDAPELDQPYGKQSRDFLSKRLAEGERFQLEVAQQEIYQKEVVALLYDARGQCLNFELLKFGLAWYVGNRDVTAESYYIYALEQHARQHQLGLWALPDPEPPWVWVARQRRQLQQRLTAAQRPSAVVVTRVPAVVVAPSPTAAAAPARASKARVAQPVPDAAARPEAVPVPAPVPARLVAPPTAPIGRMTPPVPAPVPAAPHRTAASAPWTAPVAYLLGVTLFLLLLLLSTTTNLTFRIRCALRLRALIRQVDAPALLPFAIFGTLAKVDKDVHAAAQEAIERFCDYLELSAPERDQARRIVHLSRLDLTTFKLLLQRFVALRASERDLIEALVLVCFVISHVDGNCSAEKQLYLSEICGSCAVVYADYAGQFATGQATDPYVLLGLAANAGEAEIEDRHLRLQRSYRPAALRRIGLAADDLAFALGKYREIEEAYAALRARPVV